MKFIECVHEEDVLSAVNTGRWPDRVDPDLRTHVAGCGVCRDVVAVAAAFLEAESDPHPVPDASAVWLRSQIRARAEATRRAQQPITVAQTLAFASVVGVLGALVGASSPWLQKTLQFLWEAASRLDPRAVPLPAGIATLMTEHLGIVAAVAIALMLAPVAVYWAIREN